MLQVLVETDQLAVEERVAVAVAPTPLSKRPLKESHQLVVQSVEATVALVVGLAVVRLVPLVLKLLSQHPSKKSPPTLQLVSKVAVKRAPACPAMPKCHRIILSLKTSQVQRVKMARVPPAEGRVELKPAKVVTRPLLTSWFLLVAQRAQRVKRLAQPLQVLMELVAPAVLVAAVPTLLNQHPPKESPPPVLLLVEVDLRALLRQKTQKVPKTHRKIPPTTLNRLPVHPPKHLQVVMSRPSRALAPVVVKALKSHLHLCLRVVSAPNQLVPLQVAAQSSQVPLLKIQALKESHRRLQLPPPVVLVARNRPLLALNLHPVEVVAQTLLAVKVLAQSQEKDHRALLLLLLKDRVELVKEEAEVPATLREASQPVQPLPLAEAEPAAQEPLEHLVQVPLVVLVVVAPVPPAVQDQALPPLQAVVDLLPAVEAPPVVQLLQEALVETVQTLQAVERQ